MPAAPRPSKEPGGRTGRIQQIRQVFRLTRDNDPRLIPILLAVFLGPVVLGVLLGALTGSWVLFVLLGVLLGALAGMIVFGRRAERAGLSAIEGQPGAAASLLQSLRGGWTVTPAVQVNRSGDLVHRAVGRAGVLIVAEGNGRGPRDLLATEVRRVRRVVGDTPLHDVVIGEGDGRIPLRKLQMHVRRLPRTLKPAEVKTLERRLAALSASAGGLPIPKGPMPTRMPRGKVR